MKNFLFLGYIFWIVVIVILFIGLFCRPVDQYPQSSPASSAAQSTSTNNNDQSSGIGITISGKLGLDTGWGFVVPFDGGSIDVGFGL